MYYEIPIRSTKGVLMCAMYGYTSPRREISESRHASPLSERLADDVERARVEICNDRHAAYQYIAETARPSPSATTFYYYVSGEEGETLAG